MMRRDLPEQRLVKFWRLFGFTAGAALPYGVCYLYDAPTPFWALVVIFFFGSIPFAFLCSWFFRLLFEVAWHSDEQAFFCGVLGGLVGMGTGLLPFVPVSTTHLDPDIGTVCL